MPLPLPQYTQVKDNYCIAYFGNNKEYLIQLELLIPFIESTFPGIKIYLACNENSLYLFKKHDKIITKDYLKDNKHLFGYVRELTCDMESHPVQMLMDESEIKYGPIINEEINLIPGKCVLLTNGIQPVRSLTGEQIKILKTYITNRGFQPEINSSIEDATWVIGVENEEFYKAAILGKYVTLINTGFGENIFHCMFPYGEIFNF